MSIFFFMGMLVLVKSQEESETPPHPKVDLIKLIATTLDADPLKELLQQRDEPISLHDCTDPENTAIHVGSVKRVCKYIVMQKKRNKIIKFCDRGIPQTKEACESFKKVDNDQQQKRKRQLEVELELIGEALGDSSLNDPKLKYLLEQPGAIYLHHCENPYYPVKTGDGSTTITGSENFSKVCKDIVVKENRDQIIQFCEEREHQGTSTSCGIFEQVVEEQKPKRKALCDKMKPVLDICKFTKTSLPKYRKECEEVYGTYIDGADSRRGADSKNVSFCMFAIEKLQRPEEHFNPHFNLKKFHCSTIKKIRDVCE